MNEPDWVYIPTLDRVDELKAVVPHWLARGFNVAVVCEPQEVLTLYTTLPSGVKIYGLEEDGQGAGYARQGALEYAADHGLDAFIMADDDVYPTPKPKRGRYFDAGLDPGGRFGELLNIVRAGDHRMPFCAASFSYQDLATGGKISDPQCDELVNLHNGNCYALNVRVALNCGGFDADLGMWEDAEFMRWGITRGYPWLLHTGVHYRRLNTSGATGGIATWLARTGFADRGEAERHYRMICHERWSEYVTAPDKRHGMRWQQMYADYGVPYKRPNK